MGRRPKPRNLGLGQWIRFKYVVARQRTEDGKPMRQNMGRIRTGMIIGRRFVYDQTGTNPPTLSNPQPVLVIAVSLHRSYRVLIDDVIEGWH